MVHDSANTKPADPLTNAIETLRLAIHHLTEGVIVADKQGKFLICNNTARSVLEAETDSSSCQSWMLARGWHKADGVTPCSYEELPATRALAGAPVPESDIFIRNERCPQGIWISAHANPLLDNEGRIHGSIVAFRDITRKKQDDAQLRILTNAVEQTADSIIITNKDGMIEYVNPAFETTTGYGRGEVLGNTPRILKSGVQNGEFYRNLWNTIVSGNVFRDTLANRKKNGDIFFAEQTITPMRDSAGQITHFVTVIKDVTELRKIQEHRFQLSLARAVQQQFYRMPPPQLDGFDLAGASFPADATGGDYFDFTRLPDHSIGLVTGDVSGHGVSSALLMAELRAYLRAYVRQSSDLGEILTLMNEALVADLEQSLYATLVFCQLHPDIKTLRYASAGHPPGFILDPRGGIKRTLQSINIPLGFLPEHNFTCSEPITLKPGDILALLTDGITEAERPDQKSYGARRALEFIHTHRQESARDIVKGLYGSVRDFCDGMPQADDITAVILKVKGEVNAG